MKKLFFVLTTAVLLFMTACEGSFVDPGMLDNPGGGNSIGSDDSNHGSSSGSKSKPEVPTGTTTPPTTGFGSGTEPSPYQLNAGAWTNGSITSTASNAAVWYSFTVTNGTTYYVWWNDLLDGNKTKSLDVGVTAYNTYGSSLFTGDGAYTTPKSFTATSSGTVKLKVEPFFLSETGTFAIVYSTSNSRP